jgi:hypothetical protein
MAMAKPNHCAQLTLSPVHLGVSTAIRMGCIEKIIAAVPAAMPFTKAKQAFRNKLFASKIQQSRHAVNLLSS